MARFASSVSVPPGSPPPRPAPGRRIGCHTSIAGGLAQAAERAYRLGSNTFQIFSSSPRQWKASPVDAAEARLLNRLRDKYDLYPLVVHTNYLINLAAASPLIRRKSIEALRAEIERTLLLGAEYLVMHPGSAGPQSDRRQALVRFSTALEQASRGIEFRRLRVLIENTAGAGGALGRDFEELRAILGLSERVPLGCCLDTAHCYQAGWDISTAQGLNDVLGRLHRVVGLDSLRVVHTNDSRTRLGSRADRHEHIGKGGIGLEGFRRILNHPALRQKAFILETPVEEEGDDLRNLETVRRLVRNGNKQAFSNRLSALRSRRAG